METVLGTILCHSTQLFQPDGLREGLSQSGDQYEEAIKCLTSRFNCPRLVHQTHVRMILETPRI